MKTAPVPDNEALRVLALERLGLMDTPPDVVFDSLAQAAANLCEVPIALICLVDPSRQWFKSCIGLEASETSRDVAFCAHTILDPNALMEVEDTLHDERFHDNPLVTAEPHIRFYAGQPLVTKEGYALGTLCVIDRKPRRLTFPQREALAGMANAISNLFEERRNQPPSSASAETETPGAEQQNKPIEKTERDLLLTEGKYRDLFENAHDFILSFLPDGTFEYTNPALMKTLGYTQEQMSTLKISDIIDPENLDHTNELFSQVQDGKSVGEVELRLITKDKKVVFVDGGINCRFKDGALISTRAILHNVTEHVLHERSLQAAKKVAESATEEKSRFLAAASHDLRQPLQMFDLYLTELEEISDDPQAEPLHERLRSSLSTVSEILDALLDISKLESGAVTPERQDISLDQFISPLIANLKPNADVKGLTLRAELEPCVINSDPALLARILENLIGNAIRYTNSGEVVVRVTRRRSNAMIVVEDTGVGMPPDALNSIFDEYKQLDNPNRDRRKGLGLGLSIVKHIAGLLEHKVHVRSTPGTGSAFSIQVPISEADPKANAPVTADPVPDETNDKPVVLFVDDYPDIVASTSRLFRGWGFDIHVAYDAEEALGHIEKGLEPDIIVSDYRLPGMNGVEMIAAIRDLTSPDLPALLITGDAAAKELKDARSSVIAILSKPARPRELKAIIESAKARADA